MGCPPALPLAQSPGPAAANAQARGSLSAGTPSTPAFTLHAGTRIVLTDVTVEDHDGNPVHGLDRSAFRILDNGHPQAIASFEEHRGESTAQIAPEPDAHTFSNSYYGHPPAVSNVLLFDTTALGIVDQMYLDEQMEKFVGGVPAGERLAVYLRAGEFAVMLQNFTDDHALLLAAVHKAIPHFPAPGARYTSEVGTLRQVVDYVGQLPGRKNILWFSGGSSLDLGPDGTPSGALSGSLQPVYDELEANRIAIFPVDARGLTVYSRPSMVFQHMLMWDVAKATGGQAYVNTNGLGQSATEMVEKSSSFYTLTYTPRDLHQDNKWHKVKVDIVPGAGYTLSYRRGYFDDGANLTPPPRTTRTLLRADGQTSSVGSERSAPILFTASVVPDSPLGANPLPMAQVATPAPRKNEVAYVLRYTLPAADFTPGQGKANEVDVGTGVIAFNRLGRAVNQLAQTVTLTIDPNKLRAHPTGVLRFEQRINLPYGDDFLYIAVWDPTTRRVGTLQVPLEIGK